ncbi:AMP-binding protein [Pseudonocardia sp. WMMC193]|uniref:AMP-binding protein n=1 Tax=Pseudonocardia sp. WMMC193 TaxID=2911965 RepID=UPI001F384455|nr:AMP-binding protein [Pseudonocardia sp. WMMC193]MCF7550816.1 AMP-binding protein [Pseudonocardia sp. WMMC193]
MTTADVVDPGTGGPDEVVDPLTDNIIRLVNVGDMPTRTARRSPETVAVVDARVRMTYGVFNEEVNRVAHGLLEAGYGRGDAPDAAMVNRAEFLVVHHACAKTGIIVVPIWVVEGTCRPGPAGRCRSPRSARTRWPSRCASWRTATRSSTSTPAGRRRHPRAS